MKTASRWAILPRRAGSTRLRSAANRWLGRGAQAFGWQSSATGATSLAAGHQANAAGANASALGKNANAAFAGSTALGFAATTTRANQVKLGGTGSSVTIGDLAASTAAQTGALSFTTVDASGTLGAGPLVSSFATVANVTALNTSVATLNTNVASLQTLTTAQGAQINSLFKGVDKAYEGVAMALAMESPSLPAGTNFGVSGGVGYYNDKTAATAAFAARVGENASVSAGIGFGIDSGEVGARGGFQFAW